MQKYKYKCESIFWLYKNHSLVAISKLEIKIRGMGSYF